MRKLLIAGLAICFVLVMGCGRSSEEPSTAKTNETQQAQRVQDAQESQESTQPTPPAESTEPQGAEQKTEDLPRTASPATWAIIIGIAGLMGGLYLRQWLRWLQ